MHARTWTGSEKYRARSHAITIRIFVPELPFRYWKQPSSRCNGLTVSLDVTNSSTFTTTGNVHGILHNRSEFCNRTGVSVRTEKQRLKEIPPLRISERSTVISCRSPSLHRQTPRLCYRLSGAPELAKEFRERLQKQTNLRRLRPMTDTPKRQNLRQLHHFDIET